MSNSSPLFVEQPPTTTRNRRPSLLPHPSEVNNNIFPIDYSFPPRTSPSTTTTTWSSKSNNNNNNYFYNDISSVPMLPEVSEEPFYREQRSMSYSHYQDTPFLSSFHYLNTSMIQEEEEEETEQQQQEFIRTRSKSSAAIMDIWNPKQNVQKDIEDAKWIMAATQSSNSRRSSLAIQPFNSGRRHSLANPIMSTTTHILESLSISEPLVTESIFDSIKLDDLGKGKRLDTLQSTTTIKFYLIEFKCHRSDLFYSSDISSSYKKNDIVIVEGDRGHDLGKIMMENITKSTLELYYNKLKRNIEEKNNVLQSNEMYIKYIFKKATKDEITLLMAKTQDECKALVICQSKIKQKKLSMQVVDAEYQWDRRKLTFYFVAEKRVDFRELVRELFKLYKTRIWMCSVASINSVLDKEE